MIIETSIVGSIPFVSVFLITKYDQAAKFVTKNLICVTDLSQREDGVPRHQKCRIGKESVA